MKPGQRQSAGTNYVGETMVDMIVNWIVGSVRSGK